MSEEPRTELFLRAAATAEARGWVESVLAGAEPRVRRGLLESAEASAFSLKAWIGAMAAFSAWLGARGLAAGLEDQIAYLECCATSAGAGARFEDLSALLIEMLEGHGCDAAR